MTSRKANRMGYHTVFPFEEHYDENNQNYYIDLFSKPWLYLLFNFRLLFEVDAYLIDKKYAVNRQKEIKKTNMSMVTIIAIGIFGSSLIKFITDYPIDMSLEEFNNYYRILVFCFPILFILIIQYFKQRMISKENLNKMKKVRIKMHTSFFGNIGNLFFSLLQIYLLLFTFTANGYISLYKIIGVITFSLLEIILYMFQWRVAKFSSVDVIIKE